MLPERILSIMNDRVVDILRLQPGDITIDGIADKLAKINRYNGSTEYPYSVAQHAVLVSHLLKGGMLYGLHHDDAEAFTGDWITPIKHLPNVLEAVAPIENAVQAQIWAYLGLQDRDSTELLAYVGDMDYLALCLEWEGLGLPRGLGFDPPKVGVEPWHRELLRPMHWKRAKEAYMERHWGLSNA